MMKCIPHVKQQAGGGRALREGDMAGVGQGQGLEDQQPVLPPLAVQAQRCSQEDHGPCRHSSAIHIISS